MNNEKRIDIEQTTCETKKRTTPTKNESTLSGPAVADGDTCVACVQNSPINLISKNILNKD